MKIVLEVPTFEREYNVSTPTAVLYVRRRQSLCRTTCINTF